MSQTVQITYYGMPGEGKNLTEARKNAGKNIEAALRRLGEGLRFVRVGEAMAVIWPSRWGWESKMLWSSNADRDESMVDPKYLSLTVHGTQFTPSESADDVYATTRENLLQLTWKPEFGLGHPLATKIELRSLARWFDFQLRFHKAEKAGMCYNDAHDYAGRNPQRAHLWQGKEL